MKGVKCGDLRAYGIPVTKLTSVIGEQVLLIKHNEDKTAIKHYLNKKQLLEKTKNVRLYEISGWLHNTGA